MSPPASRKPSAVALASDVPVRRSLFGAPDPSADDLWQLPPQPSPQPLPQRAWGERVEDEDGGDDDAHVITLFRRLRGARGVNGAPLGADELGVVAPPVVSEVRMMWREEVRDVNGPRRKSKS